MLKWARDEDLYLIPLYLIGTMLFSESESVNTAGIMILPKNTIETQI